MSMILDYITFALLVLAGTVVIYAGAWFIMVYVDKGSKIKK